MNTFAIGSLPVHFSVAKLFTFRWQYTLPKLIFNNLLNPSFFWVLFYPTFHDCILSTFSLAELVTDVLKKG